MKKGQTVLEYSIILAIIIVFSMIIYFLLDSPADRLSISQSKSYWHNISPISIYDWDITNKKLKLVFGNNHIYTYIINKIFVDSNEYNVSLKLYPGKQQIVELPVEFNCYNYNTPTLIQIKLGFEYVDNLTHIFFGKKPIIGYCRYVPPLYFYFKDYRFEDFNKGIFTLTHYDNGVLLNNVHHGYFESRVFDAGKKLLWDQIKFYSDDKYYKKLPDNQQIIGDINMSGNLVLFHFDENILNNNDIVHDSSGNNNHAIVVSNSNKSSPVGKINRTFYLSRYSHIFLGQNPIYFRDKFTIEFWFYPNILQYESGLFTNHSNYNYGLTIAAGSHKNIVVEVGDGNNTYELQWAGTLYQKHWYHIAVTYDQNILKLYVNGAYAGEINATILNQNPSTGAALGCYLYNANNNYCRYYFDGYIDEFALFDRPLSAEEIRNHYLNAVGSINFYIESCNSADCSDGTYIGNSSDTYMNYTNFAYDLSSYNLRSRYFRYKIQYNTLVSAYAPKITKVEIRAKKI